MFCLKCGNELHLGEKFCPICGTPVPEERKKEVSDDLHGKNQNTLYRTTREERKKEAKREKIILGVLGALIIVLVISIVGGVFWLMTNGKETGAAIDFPERINMEEDDMDETQEEEKKPPVTPEPTKEGEAQVETSQQELQPEVEPTQPEQPVIEQVEPEEIPEEQNMEENSSNGDFIIPDSATRFLTNADLNILTTEEIRIARNEIFARHGRIFKSKDMNDYFGKKDWYKPSVPAEQFDNSYLNKIELENLKLITNYEKAHNMN